MGDDEKQALTGRERVEGARAAARTQCERALALVLDRLLVEGGVALGRLVAFGPTGQEAARVERGPVDEARATAAFDAPDALAALRQHEGALTLPLSLGGLPSAVAYLEGSVGSAPAAWAEAAARASIGVANALHLAEAQVQLELRALLAHEIRNPLAGVLSFSDLLPDEASELPAKYVHLMSNIQEDAQKLKRLIEAVLVLVHARPSICGCADLGEVLGGLATRFRPWAERRGVDLEVAVAGSVLAEREALALAVGNLVANAIAATPPGGRVAIRSRPGPDRERRWGAPGRAVWIEVVDAGPGLAAGILESARAGGLQIARDLVTRMGGALWSEEGQAGGRLVLRLPASLR